MSSLTKKEMEILSSPTFQQIINQHLENPSRRTILKGSVGVAALGFLGLAGCGGGDGAVAGAPRSTQLNAVGFSSTSLSTADSVIVAEGYQYQVLYKLGDPIAAGVADYMNDGSDAANNPSEFQFRSGDHHDGMYFFGIGSNNAWDPEASDRGLLVVNHEAITPLFLHVNGPTSVAGVRDANEALKEMYIHGVSVVEVRRGSNGQYSVVQNSLFNRRIHTLTDMEISGPLRGNPFMVTKYSPNGTRTRGTINNCASGYTPWGTYLACEENWAGYFGNSNPGTRTSNEQASMRRYGVRATVGNGREGWNTASEVGQVGEPFSRWNVGIVGATAADDYRNAANTYGWNVEIDPFRPNSIPKKRTAMGRFAHEGAWVGPVEAGKPVVFYMGCDSRYEYIYKFVSTANWDPADMMGGLQAGDKYLDFGKLYVAKFDADFTGEWIDLTTVANGTTITAVRGSGSLSTAPITYTVTDSNEQFWNTRLLADIAGGTPMDRPEWGGVNPRNGEVYMTLTNNTSRRVADPANPRVYFDNDTDGDGVGDAGSQGNVNGHVIRWREDGSDPAATSFEWDIYLFGAEDDDIDNPNVNLSGLTTENVLSSPDGLWFSEKTGVLYIQTDDGAFTDTTNCMLVAAVPGEVGDGAEVDVDNTAGGAGVVRTKVGAVGTLRRLVVGPKDCEITGLTESGDGKALFINIQHPGEETSDLANPTSSWPYPLAGGGFGNPAAGVTPSGTIRPRSATIVLTRIDGGLIGQ
ncbi:MAG: phosphatase [Limnobacter sp. CACIAM 66H1]|uniref:PhoX family protein n=1 Tax=Limnobacter sp. CACIAM 66H1 TaxID=1813033 RepID=UPI0007A89CA7|nr:PhoX family phosphatase [Limnobacter sp. CACIAM 66H1]KYP11450.1 MAG: phosphatase [Limnobacter sp. CACIAM 66H1]